jgi:hypothetical protein
MVDDQHETSRVEVLQKLKANHEKWVSSRLTEEQRQPPIRLRRVKGNIPSHLVRLTSGRDVMTIVGGSSAFSFDHDEPQSEAEVKLLSGFLQEVQDWGDLSADLEAGDCVKAAFRMTTLLRELEEAGFSADERLSASKAASAHRRRSQSESSGSFDPRIPRSLGWTSRPQRISRQAARPLMPRGAMSNTWLERTDGTRLLTACR